MPPSDEYLAGWHDAMEEARVGMPALRYKPLPGVWRWIRENRGACEGKATLEIAWAAGILEKRIGLRINKEDSSALRFMLKRVGMYETYEIRQERSVLVWTWDDSHPGIDPYPYDD